MAEKGHVAWDMGKYEFLLEGKDYDTIHQMLLEKISSDPIYSLLDGVVVLIDKGI